MSSLADLFTPTFLIYLGVLLLVVCLLVVYFESKLREQNHKITSMLSLVSTLAEDINSVKFGLNHLALNFAGGSQPLDNSIKSFNLSENNDLISVSDESKSEDSESNSDSESEYDENDFEDDNELKLQENQDNFELEENIDDLDSESDSDSDSEIDETSEIKVLKINIQQEEDSNKEIENLALPLNEDLIEEINQDLNEDLNQDLNQDLTEFEDSNEKIALEENEINFDKNDLKSININLEENKNEPIDYKKLSLNKLRSIISEKGLASDTTKLKKPEIYKLLGIE
jgi:hypothetical protein